nr:DNA excision repair protein ERCC-8 [Crypthecodinium cohnii]USW07846.1 DNA excision repair protein ERCC-8 [Crypthecodinium cohnii]
MSTASEPNALGAGAAWRGDGQVNLTVSCRPHGGAAITKVATEGRRQRLVATGAEDGGLRLLELRSLLGKPRAVMDPCGREEVGGSSSSSFPPQNGAGHAGRIQALAWLPGDDRLFVSGGGSLLKIWDASAPQKSVLDLDLHSHVQGAAVTNSPSPLAAVALEDGTLRLVDLRIGRAVNTMQGHTRTPLCVAWGGMLDKKLYSGGMDGTLRAWDPRMGARSLWCFDPYANEKGQAPLKTLDDESEPAERNHFGKRKREELEALMAIGSNNVQPFRLRTARSVFRSATTNCSASIGRLGTGSARMASDPVSSEMPCLAELSKDIRDESSSAEELERARHFLDPPRRQFQHEASSAHRGAVTAVVTPLRSSLDAKGPHNVLLSCGVDGKIRKWDAERGVPLGRRSAFDVESSMLERGVQIAAHGSPQDLSFVPEKNVVTAYCTRSGELLCRLEAHTSMVHCVEVLPGCSQVLSAGADGRLISWRARSDSDNSSVFANVVTLDD